jgi:hypothetical protein
MEFKAALHKVENGALATSAFDDVLQNGLVRSADEYQTVMEELDNFIQSTDELTQDDRERIHAVNRILAKFESAPK